MDSRQACVTAAYLALTVLCGCMGNPWADVPVACRSDLGTYLHHKNGATSLDCEGLSQHEANIIRVTEELMGVKYADRLRRDLPEIHVLVWPHDQTLSYKSPTVLGYYDCMGSVVVKEGGGRFQSYWAFTALAHEYTHVGQGCDAYSPKPNTKLGDPGDEDPDHANYVTSGSAGVESHFYEEQDQIIVDLYRAEVSE